MPGASVINAAEPNVGGHRETASVGKEIWNGRIGDGERIKRVRDWHTDIEATKAYVSAGDLKGVGKKGHRCQGRVKKCPNILKVAKHRQVFVTHIAHERAIKGLAIRRRKRWRESCEIKEEVVAAALIISAELWKVLECIGPDDTGSAWIRIGINRTRRPRWDIGSKKGEIGLLIKWRSRRIWCRVWQ